MNTNIVYVLCCEKDNTPGILLGVYTSLDKAKENANKLYKKEENWYYIIRVLINKEADFKTDDNIIYSVGG